MNTYVIIIITFHLSNWNHASSVDVEHKKITYFMEKQVLKKEPLELDPSKQDITLKIFGPIFENTFDKFRTIRHFSLINSHVTNMEVNALKKLESLESLSFIHNKGNLNLTEISLKKTTHLKELIIHLNNRIIIESNVLKNLKKLEVLSVDNQTYNAFSNETFDKCRKLKYLSWTNGFVGKIDSNTFRSLKQLVTLILKDLQLEHIEPSTFKDLPLLNILNLDENKIKHLSGKEFELLPSLQILTIEKNFLISIDYTTILGNLINLRILNISHNKLPCNIISKLKHEVIKLNAKEQRRCDHLDMEIQIYSA